MKGKTKILNFILVFSLFFPFLSNSQVPPPPDKGITLIFPNGGEQLFLDSTYTIRWEFFGQISKIGIVLYKGKETLGFIAKDIPATQKAFMWKIENLDEGEDYKIGIFEYPWEEGKPVDYSDESFSIRKEFSPATLTIHNHLLYPVSNQNSPVIYLSIKDNLERIFALYDPDGTGKKSSIDVSCEADWIVENPSIVTVEKYFGKMTSGSPQCSEVYLSAHNSGLTNVQVQYKNLTASIFVSVAGYPEFEISPKEIVLGSKESLPIAALYSWPSLEKYFPKKVSDYYSFYGQSPNIPLDLGCNAEWSVLNENLSQLITFEKKGEKPNCRVWLKIGEVTQEISTVIKATYFDPFSRSLLEAKANLKIKAEPQQKFLEIRPSEITLSLGEEEILNAFYSSKDVSCETNWSLEDSSLAQISRQAKLKEGECEIIIKGLKEGITTLKAQYQNFLATALVRVISLTPSLEIEPKEFILLSEKSKEVKAIYDPDGPEKSEYLPQDVSCKANWSVSNSDLLKVEKEIENGECQRVIVNAFKINQNITTFLEVSYEDPNHKKLFAQARIDLKREGDEEKSLRVIFPNGGERLLVGKTYTIAWESKNLGKVEIDLIDSKGNTFSLTKGILASLGKYDWTISEEVYDFNAYYFIEIGDEKNKTFDGSDEFFKIFKGKETNLICQEDGDCLFGSDVGICYQGKCYQIEKPKTEPGCQSDGDCTWCEGNCLPWKIAEKCPGSFSPLPGYECVCKNNTCEKEKISEVEDPISGTLTVNKNNFSIGENIILTINAEDENGIDSVAAHYQGEWHQESCNGEKTCTKTFTFSENQPGEYYYFGYLYGLKIDGKIEEKWTDPASLKVIVATPMKECQTDGDCGWCEEQCVPFGIFEKCPGSTSPPAGYGCFCKSGKCEEEKISEVEDPISGTLSINRTIVSVGETLNLTIEAQDENGIEKIAAYYKGDWHEHNCQKQKTCSETFVFSEENVGNYTYFGYLWGYKANGGKEESWTQPSLLTVTVVPTGGGGGGGGGGEKPFDYIMEQFENFFNQILDFFQ